MLRVTFDSWQDVTLGREDQDTVFAEYARTARVFGQHQQQRMERIGAEVLTDLVVDSVTAPLIMGQIAGQALLGDAESQALLRKMGEEIKAFATRPANYISESNREQLAKADALELAGQHDEADRLRIRVALENQSMLMGAGGLVASLPRIVSAIVSRPGRVVPDGGSIGPEVNASNNNVTPSTTRADQPTQTIPNQLDDFQHGSVTAHYDATNVGPLGNNVDGLAGTFSGGRYTEVVLDKDVVLHRAGSSDRPLGQFFTQESPESIIKTRIDSAVLPTWPNGAASPIDSKFTVKIPAGTKVYVGEVSAQGGHFVGGTQQIVVPNPWLIEGVEVLERAPLK